LKNPIIIVICRVWDKTFRKITGEHSQTLETRMKHESLYIKKPLAHKLAHGLSLPLSRVQWRWLIIKRCWYKMWCFSISMLDLTGFLTKIEQDIIKIKKGVFIGCG